MVPVLNCWSISLENTVVGLTYAVLSFVPSVSLHRPAPRARRGTEAPAALVVAHITSCCCSRQRAYLFTCLLDGGLNFNLGPGCTVQATGWCIVQRRQSVSPLCMCKIVTAATSIYSGALVASQIEDKVTCFRFAMHRREALGHTNAT